MYLAGFETVVREAAPKTVMTSYNLLNGTYTNEDPFLLRRVLRGEWGYRGAVVTDWVASHDHAAAVACGGDFEMPAPGTTSVRELVEAVRAGEVAEFDVDARVGEALDLVFSTTRVTAAAPRSFDEQGHHEVARDVARRSAVVLKNEGGLLPLAPGTRVAVVGDFAQTPRYQGAGSSLVNATRVDTLVGAVKASGLEFVGFEPGFPRSGEPDPALVDAACELASTADVVICNLGLDETRETEGAERADMAMAPAQVALMERLAAANPRIVVVLSAGSCVEMEWEPCAQAVLYECLGGQAGAGAMVDLVEGRANPSGKLAETWPLRLDDTPCAGRFPAETRLSLYREGPYVGYRYYQTAGVPVRYPFGFGLSYTEFSYSDLEVLVEDGDRPRAFVGLTVSNVGGVAGAEVVQVYVAKPGAAVWRPAQELRSFTKVLLEPGESRRVLLDLDDRAFAYWNVATDGWEVEGAPTRSA